MIISVSQTCTVPNTDKSCDMIWNMEFWNAKNMPGGEEAHVFSGGYGARHGR